MTETPYNPYDDPEVDHASQDPDSTAEVDHDEPDEGESEEEESGGS